MKEKKDKKELALVMVLRACFISFLGLYLVSRWHPSFLSFSTLHTFSVHRAAPHPFLLLCLLIESETAHPIQDPYFEMQMDVIEQTEDRQTNKNMDVVGDIPPFGLLPRFNFLEGE
jgi:hypothetical protein